MAECKYGQCDGSGEIDTPVGTYYCECYEDSPKGREENREASIGELCKLVEDVTRLWDTDTLDDKEWWTALENLKAFDLNRIKGGE